MKRYWREILMALGSALSSMIVAALMQDKQQQGESHATKQPHRAGTSAQQSRTKRDDAIHFLSDVLAEAYRKIRSDKDVHRR